MTTIKKIPHPLGYKIEFIEEERMPVRRKINKNLDKKVAVSKEAIDLSKNEKKTTKLIKKRIDRTSKKFVDDAWAWYLSLGKE